MGGTIDVVDRGGRVKGFHVASVLVRVPLEGGPYPILCQNPVLPGLLFSDVTQFHAGFFAAFSSKREDFLEEIHFVDYTFKPVDLQG